MVDSSREAFEKWALSQWPNLDIGWCSECSSASHYESGPAQNLYAAWQASRSAAIEECAVVMEKAWRKGFTWEETRDEILLLKGEG